MNMALLIVAVAFAAFCIWLGVRIFNRREKWAKRTAVATVMVMILYPLSFGPACWIAGDNETGLDAIPNAYYPILWTARALRQRVAPGQFEASRLDRCIQWYSTFGRSDGAWPYLAPMGEKRWAVPPDPDPDQAPEK